MVDLLWNWWNKSPVGPLLAWDFQGPDFFVSLSCILFLQVDPPKQHNDCPHLQRGMLARGDHVAGEGHSVSRRAKFNPALPPPPAPSPQLGPRHTWLCHCCYFKTVRAVHSSYTTTNRCYLMKRGTGFLCLCSLGYLLVWFRFSEWK